MPRKTISARQLAANRANAKKSTGPRTPAAKAAVSLNALRHGLTGKSAVLPDEDLAAHAAFCAALIRELAPANAAELNLAQAIANDEWRLNRARSIENNMLAIGILTDDPDPDHDPAMQAAFASAQTFFDHVDKFTLLTLYEQRINRTISKNMAALHQLQAERREAIRLAVQAIVDNSSATSDLQPERPPNGIVCENSESTLEAAA